MQTRRREYVKLSAPTLDELAQRVGAEDAAWRDRGYMKFDWREPTHYGDVYATELVYEEAARDSDVVRRAEAMGTRRRGVSSVGILLIILVITALILNARGLI